MRRVRVFTISFGTVAMVLSGASWAIADEATSGDKLDMLVELRATVPFDKAITRLDSDCGRSCALEVRFARAVVAYNLSLCDELSNAERARYLQVAISDFERVIGQAPNDALARRYLGLSVIRATADFVTAEKHFRAAWDSGARAIDFIDSYAYVLIAVGKFDRASTVLKEADLNERTFDSNYLLAVAQLGLKQFSEAAESARRALAIQESVKARILLASALSQLGALSDALKELEIAGKTDSANLDVSRARIAILRKMGNLDAAILEAKSAAVLHPKDQGIAKLLDELTRASRGQ